MVWSQYVYEATAGLDAEEHSGDEDQATLDHTPVNKHDWETEYSEELMHLWDALRVLTYDAMLNYDVLVTGSSLFGFSEFCFKDHTDENAEPFNVPYEAKLRYIWSYLVRERDYMGLTNEFFRNAKFYDFADFIVEHSFLH